jgi:hypothetical protein
MRLWRYVVAGSLVAAGVQAAPLPADVSGESWFSHCRGLSAARMTHYADVKDYRITYAWRTETGYLWDWENGAKAGDHYCTRVALYGRGRRHIEDVTFLCSVGDRGLPTETWTFGNAEVAGRFCPLAKADLKTMDAAAVLNR